MTTISSPLPLASPLDAGRRRYSRPLLFFGLSLLVPWALWAAAAVLSHAESAPASAPLLIAALGLAGLCAPTVVAAALILPRADLRRDVRARLVGGRQAPRWTWGAAIGLLPASLLVATLISVMAGGDPEQFLPRGGFTFTSGVLPVWFILGGAAVLEELAWHSYGTDALTSRFSMLTATLVFAVYWAAWHVPLAGIKGYYQAEVVETGWIGSVTFLLSIPAFLLVMNWLYMRSGRSIAIAVLVHLCANYANEVLRTDDSTKLIQTVVLLVLGVVLVWKDRKLFLAPPADGDA